MSLGTRHFFSKKRIEVAVLIMGITFFGYGVFVRSGKAGPRVDPASVPAKLNAQDFSQFHHGNPMHARLPCLLCHKRDDASVAPKFSGHLPCSGCHVQQFADSSSGICTICHTNASTGAMRPFPTLRDFDTRFDHSKHVSRANCATCHRSSRGGIALSVPAGTGGHATCFKCHGPQTEVAGRNIGSCSICHVFDRPRRNSDWAKAYSVNFSHSKHLAGGKLNCVSCHTVRAAARVDQVSEPLASMHFAPASRTSCATCHNNKRAFGPQDFDNCSRCHTGRSFKF